MNKKHDNAKLTCEVTNWPDDVIVLGLADVFPSSTYIWIPCLV